MHALLLPERQLDRADYQRFFTPALRWVQVCTTGSSDNITPEIEDGSVKLTNAPGIHTVAITESVLAAMLDHATRFKQRREDQRARAWRQRANDELAGRVVLIAGLGRIGQRVAALRHAFGMRVVGTMRTPGAMVHVDEIVLPEALVQHITQAEYVVLALPHTPQTVGLMGEQVLAAMKRSAYLINVGRGSAVDEAALVDALRREQITGAYLDSSPHIGDRMVDLFCAHLRRYVQDLPLEHVCDPGRDTDLVPPPRLVGGHALTGGHAALDRGLKEAYIGK